MDVVAFRTEGDVWVVNVLGIGFTQALTRADVPMMATDLVSMLLGDDPAQVDVHVHYTKTAQ